MGDGLVATDGIRVRTLDDLARGSDRQRVFGFATRRKGKEEKRATLAVENSGPGADGDRGPVPRPRRWRTKSNTATTGCANMGTSCGVGEASAVPEVRAAPLKATSFMWTATLASQVAPHAAAPLTPVHEVQWKERYVETTRCSGRSAILSCGRRNSTGCGAI